MCDIDVYAQSPTHVKIFKKLTKINDLTQNTCYLFDHKNALKIRFLTEFHVLFDVNSLLREKTRETP